MKKQDIGRKLGILCVLVLFSVTGGTAFAGAAENIYTNSIGMEFILVPSGTFTMGADGKLENADFPEEPQHRVTISQPFYLGKYEVTQAQWEALMGSNPSELVGRDNPVEMVSWDDVQIFIQRLNEKEGHNRYRLPTEAEWEYAARAGTETPYFFGSNESELSQYAWYSYTAERVAHPVGQKESNPWGFYDMYGNVAEWVQDWYEELYYRDSPGIDPKGPSSGHYRVYRGGSFFSYPKHCRSAYRWRGTPGYFFWEIGFRLALTPE